MTKEKYKNLYLFKVPNDEEGNRFIDEFKSIANTDRYSIRKRGSGSPKETEKKANMPRGTYRSHIPLEYASHIRVYIDDEETRRIDQERFRKLWTIERDLKDKLKYTLTALTIMNAHINNKNYGLAQDRLEDLDDSIRELLSELYGRIW